MINIYLCLRYVLFGVFIVCNAIIASVAVWNLSLAQTAQLNFPVIAYLVFLGASGLAFIFTVIFIELARRNALTSRVWFDCTWVAIYFIMELAGASAFSSLVPAKMCSKQVEKQAHGSCISTQVLLAFTWICTIILLCYLLILTISSFIHHKHDSRIWQCNIHNFPSCGSGRLASAPPTPTLPRFISRAPTIVAPKPRRPPPAELLSYRSGLSPEYEIEHYRPPTHLASQPVPPIPAASSNLHRMQSTRLAAANYVPTTFYPQAVQSSMITQPTPSQQPQARQQSNAAPSPPPLGDWPRADVLLQSSRSRRLPTSPEMSETPSTSPSRQRPTGPRKRSTSGDNNRPPPLDLSKISAFREK